MSKILFIELNIEKCVTTSRWEKTFGCLWHWRKLSIRNESSTNLFSKNTFVNISNLFVTEEKLNLYLA